MLPEKSSHQPWIGWNVNDKHEWRLLSFAYDSPFVGSAEYKIRCNCRQEFDISGALVRAATGGELPSDKHSYHRNVEYTKKHIDLVLGILHRTKSNFAIELLDCDLGFIKYSLES